MTNRQKLGVVFVCTSQMVAGIYDPSWTHLVSGLLLINGIGLWIDAKRKERR